MEEFNLNEVDRLLTTTRAVRKRLDLGRPVPRDLILDCIRLSTQAPAGGNYQKWRWVRVADPDPTLVAIALDAKADGVLVPYCEDAETIQRCAWKTYLHPLKGKAFEDVLKSGKFPSEKTKEYLNKKNGHKIY